MFRRIRLVKRGAAIHLVGKTTCLSSSIEWDFFRKRSATIGEEGTKKIRSEDIRMAIYSLLNFGHLPIDSQSLDILGLVVVRRNFGEPFRLQRHDGAHELLARQDEFVEDNPFRSDVH